MSNCLVFGRFMLPRGGVGSAWSTIACDQYTSRPEYWKAEEERVGDEPSALRLICPEAFLSEVSDRLSGIAACSLDYVKNVLVEYKGGVLVKRACSHGTRYGLVCLVDLEEYDYRTGDSPVRATEGTVTARIPPRLAVRKASALDVSHVICLIDDPGCTLIEPLIGKGEPLYDISLPGGGRLEGSLITDTSAPERAIAALESEAAKTGKPFVLVGDGNHSLAAAKALYEKYKAEGDGRAATARYALVEVENVRSDGVIFLPIHRVVYGCPDIADRLEENLRGDGKVTLVRSDVGVKLSAPSDPAEAYAAVQKIIDESGAETDYIHGDGELLRICAERSDAVGVLMPPLGKDGLFAYIAAHGTLPRKSFSLGEAEDKRYYVECRHIDDKGI